MSAPAEPVLEVEGVSRRYARHWALRRLTCEIRAGEVVVLAGDNGAGKSTL